MSARLRDALSNEKLELIMCGFGAGLSWGVAQIITNKIKVLPIIEM
jgi:3-oxoacyl-[acyl-carrier-protein] synthase-3